MNEPAESIAAATPKPKLKVKRRRRTGRLLPFKAPEEFAGMTANECCSACKVDRCVISETNICTHPYKSPIQPAMMANAKILARYQRAKTALAHQKIDLRGV